MAKLNSCVRICDTDMADPGQSCTLRCHLIQDQVHRRIIGICFQYCYDRSSTAYLPIHFGKEIVYTILCTCVRIWEMARSFVAILNLLLAYGQSSGALESPGHISSWLSLHICQSHSAINTVDTIIEFQSQNKRHELTYSWQHCSLGRTIIMVRAHLRSASQGVGDWDKAPVFMAKLHLSPLSMSWPIIWPMIEVQAQLRFAIQSRMTFLDFNEVNVGKLWLIVNVSFHVRHASTATISLRSTCSTLHSAQFILVCFILSMFFLALNQWMQCTQIVISQDTAQSGAGGWSRSPSANISIYAWSVCEGRRKDALNCLLRVNCPLEEGSPAQLNHKCTDLAKYQPHLTRYCLVVCLDLCFQILNSFCIIELCQKSCSLRARISKDRFCPATLHDGRQLPLTHEPHLFKEA